MILLDTHIWVWWIDGDPRLEDSYVEAIEAEQDGIGVSVMTCWEVAKRIESEAFKLPKNKSMLLSMPVDDWIDAALRQPGVVLIPLTPAIAVESTRLPDDYRKINRDPADQIIIATSRVENLPLMTVDTLITPYPHVRIWKPS